MEDKICLDTDFLIDFLRNKKEEVEFIKKNEFDKELATTYINLFELYYGAYKSDKSAKNLELIKTLVRRINLLNLSENSVEKAGEISAFLEKEGSSVDFRDVLIGSISLVNGYALKTNNAKHFSKIKGLTVL